MLVCLLFILLLLACLWCVVRCSLFVCVACCSLRVGWWLLAPLNTVSLFLVCWRSLCVARCSMFVVGCVLIVLIVVRCWLCVVRRLLFVVSCWSLVVL